MWKMTESAAKVNTSVSVRFEKRCKLSAISQAQRHLQRSARKTKRNERTQRMLTLLSNLLEPAFRVCILLLWHRLGHKN